MRSCMRTPGRPRFGCMCNVAPAVWRSVRCGAVRCSHITHARGSTPPSGGGIDGAVWCRWRRGRECGRGCLAVCAPGVRAPPAPLLSASHCRALWRLRAEGCPPSSPVHQRARRGAPPAFLSSVRVWKRERDTHVRLSTSSGSLSAGSLAVMYAPGLPSPSLPPSYLPRCPCFRSDGPSGGGSGRWRWGSARRHRDVSWARGKGAG
jgi:hypothetical protein